MSNPESKDKRSIDRRRFLTTFAAGAAAAPLLSLGRGAFARSGDQAASLCYSNKRVLRDSDLQYLGAMRCPAEGAWMDFSTGTLTGRKVNGQTRLIMSGNITMGDPVYEFAEASAFGLDPATAPRMSLVKTWGDIYGQSRKTWTPAGVEKTTYPRYPGALYWNESKQLLYWTYVNTYNVTGEDEWCLGASKLDPAGVTAYGPWRPSGEGKKGSWRCIRITESPAGELLCGSGVMSGAASSPWGPDMWAGAFPTATTPAGFGTPDLPIVKYLTYYPMTVGRDGSWAGPIRSARRPGDYTFEPLSSGVLTEIDPKKNGGVGSWTQMDGLGGALWIDLPEVHGVLFNGRFGAGHLWYRNEAVGNDRCVHGMAAPAQITGPVSTDMYPVMIFYDPADLHAVRQGSRVDYTIDAAQIINAHDRFGLKTAPITSVGSAKNLGGSYFDPATRRLYVAAPDADDSTPGMYMPLVHVFRIN